MNMVSRWFAVMVATVALGVAAAAQPAPVLDIGSRLELFVDGYLTDTFQGAALRLHAPDPAEMVIAFDKPWEGRFSAYPTILKDGDLYRLYYRGSAQAGQDGSTAEVTCYAESPNGIVFTKPKLGIYEVGGTKENNVVLASAAPCTHNFAPFLDTRITVAPEERYKALGGNDGSGLIAFASPDGLHWNKLREEPVITKGVFDSLNVAFWSASEECYVCYFRNWTDGPFEGFRTVNRTTSKDFLTWTPPEDMSYGDTPREHIYTNQTQPYFRAPHIYIAVAARLVPERQALTVEQALELGGDPLLAVDCSDTVLMTTRGGNRYDRAFMESFVRPGIGLRNWVSSTNFMARGVVPTSPNEMSMYIQRNYGLANNGLQRLVLRTDGFVSVNAPYAGGECVTKPLRFSGRELVLNMATSAAGSVRVEVRDESGAAMSGYGQDDCDEIIGDEVARVVSWKGKTDVSGLAGKPVRLRFVMKDADLYSIQFR